MSHPSPGDVRPLPERPNLRHLKDQARDLLQSGQAASLTDAQFQIARLYGFASWPKLKAHLESLQAAGQLKRAIDQNDLERVKDLMTRNPALHRAPLGYGKSGPLTWVAECRVPWGPPTPVRLEMARWMIENGSDVHQGSDGPLSRAALNGDRIPMMELLVAHGADVNAEWNGHFPILFSPCEAVDPEPLRWLLEHGADPNCDKPGRRDTALDYLIGSYARSAELPLCIDLLLQAGGKTRYDLPGVMPILQGRSTELAALLDADPGLAHRRYPELDFGTTGGRRLTLEGAMLLHVAAEYGQGEAARLLLDRGADVNGQAAIQASGIGGQTPLFHCVTQFRDAGLEMTRLLLHAGADRSIRVRLPGHYERLEDVVECTPLEYAERFPGEEWPGSNSQTLALLRT